jgi:hypothetical protein
MSLLPSFSALDERGQAGDWCFTDGDGYLIVRLHAGDDGIAAIAVKPDPDIPGKPVWRWDGNREAPTLEPSILHHSNPPWHGWLRAGRLVLA